RVEGRSRGCRSCPLGSAPPRRRRIGGLRARAEVPPTGPALFATLLLCGRGTSEPCGPDGSLLLAREPLPELVADVAERVADVLERVAHARRVVLLRGAGLVAQGRLLAAADVLAVLDAVVVAAAYPGEELVRAADRHRV